ncbi:ventricular zone-expressed PH domain-containing protein homolog 1 isoform X2 [Ornithorhynchus anatinus]|uniref:ventricular zone-expressed PH domain-containing protein homolog 1 isoform X2 n=1 Tax=Ornithorhynchus anatinus TaxID=9258 RepID=UPI0010A884BF|nr:ventricular zone-expressed PH domain-containing protein homolog 1 isoform X2 [Ornithorhynchus anatinus]
MHHLFRLVLGQKDLSRAGDLFSLDDSEIEESLSEALEQIEIISSSSDYQTNDNDQAVVEICITRITTAIRETESIEKHGKALVTLWESCLEHNLKPSGKDEDTPHAKIASDIMSCILQNYNRPPVMALAIPVAVKFLQRGNKELCRNMSSYLSLAAITKADLLADHTEAIVNSILQGNSILLRVLPSVYDKEPLPINRHLTELLALMSQLEQANQHHLLRLLQAVTKQKQPEVLKECIPFLIGHLRDPAHVDVILNILIEISGYEPVALTSFLPMLKEIGESFPNLIGQTAKIYGAVGHMDEEKARSSLIYLVNQLANVEHSFHHSLLLEIKNITDTFSSILGPQSRDIYRMSNSFTTIAKLLIQQLGNDEVRGNRTERVTEAESVEQLKDVKSAVKEIEEEEKLRDKAQVFEEKISMENSTPDSLRRHSLGQVPKEERKDIRFNRTKSLALNAIRTKCLSSDDGQDMGNEDITSPLSFLETDLSQENDKLPLNTDNEESQLENLSVSHPDTIRSCVTKLFFSCSLKGDYCLYSKSSFTLISHQPQLWIHIMFLFQQSLFPEPLSIQTNSVQVLRALWEKTQIKGTHSFETTMIQSTFPHKKDLDQVQMHLEEARFFDLFGFSEEAGAWQCFMCNNPEKATVVNQDGQPLMEGKLKEKQVRWKFIKRWKTRYFTLAGNQLLFRKGKSKDDPDDCPIELSKVQSVKVVAKKRRDRSLPRAFEIFTDNKTYVFKAKDEKNAEEWLQCINVAVAQAKERENGEATTYL